MDSIFHEQQEGQLCAQHCLNNLLQGPYFTAVELADHAWALDEAERRRMAEGPGGQDSAEFLRFVQQPSSNMDDSGFFSMQVISRALRALNLELVILSSPSMQHAQDNPVAQKAFICNHDYHWLTIRKLGLQWFNLDSLHEEPQLISDTYLSLFLTQLRVEGYSIFVVTGNLPSCEADQLLSLVPVEPPKPVQLPPTSHSHDHRPRHSESSEWENEEWQLSMAISASLDDHHPEVGPVPVPVHPGTGSSPNLTMPQSPATSTSTSVPFPGQDSGTSSNPSLVAVQVQNSQQTASGPDHLVPVSTASLVSDTESGTVKPLSEEELRQRRLKHFGQLKPPGGTD